MVSPQLCSAPAPIAVNDTSGGTAVRSLIDRPQHVAPPGPMAQAWSQPADTVGELAVGRIGLLVSVRGPNT